MGEVADSPPTWNRSSLCEPVRTEFRILGSLEVDVARAPVPLGGPKQQAVLAHLIVHRNELVSAEALVDELWGEAPPDYARNNVQTYVSHLRRVLGRDRIQWRPPGYLLRVDAADLDAARFEGLVREARKARPVNPSLAIADLDEALALWRGRPFAGLTEQGSLLTEATRLDEVRLAAQEERFEALLATDDHARVIGELEVLVANHPLRESFWALLMLAYYRGGRQAEALAVFRRAGKVLAGELGIDPSPELVRLHERILRQDSTLLLRGEPLRGYRLLEKIVDGPRASVFRAIQPRIERDVAVKIFDGATASDAEFVRCFEPSAQAVAALEHPHIVPIYDYWREPGRAYLVSRYFRGESLQALLERGEAVGADRAVKVVGQVASALAFAHQQGVVHGNVHSSNVLFDGDGNAYLGDFLMAVGPVADSASDVRELARLTTLLLGDAKPDRLRALTEQAERGTDVPEAMAFADAAGEFLAQATDVAPLHPDPRNPYKGLRSFTEADAHDFFGRSGLIRRLIARLQEPGAGSRFLAVIGPSGSGKSSVVRAGLVPALRGGALIDPQRCFVAEMIPGAHPIEELEAALLRIAVRSIARVHDLLDAGSRGLLQAVDLVAPERAEVVLIVDQFEELFTVCTGERERQHFLESLRVATADPESRVRVIVTLRADFYDRPLTYPRFGELLAARTEAVPPLTPEELEQAIRRPAEQLGVNPEPGLVAEMIAEVAHEPGALPLLQYSLTDLFERREQNRLTLEAHRELGGVTASLSARADRILAASDHEEGRAIKQVFLRLVTLGEGRPDTRRRVPRGDLDALEVDPAAIDAVLEVFGRHRLLTFDRDPATREPTVEIAHEALLTAWGRLRGWIETARDDLRQDRRIARAAAEWRLADCDPSFLPRGAQLEQITAWAEHTDLAIGYTERAYLTASTSEREYERHQEELRRWHEARIERRSRTRLRGMVAVFAAAALIAGVLTVVAREQSQRAGREARIATARELAAAAVANLDVDPERGILLAIQAVRETRSNDGTVLPEAEEALHRAVTASRAALTVPALGGRLDWSPTGVFVTEGLDGSGMIDIRNATTGKRVLAFSGHDGDVTDVAFSADGSKLATTGDDGWLKVWDPTTKRSLASLSEPEIQAGNPISDAFGPAFSADGSLVGAVWGDGVVQIMNLATKQVVFSRRLAALPASLRTETALDQFDHPEDLAFSPDGRHFAVTFIYRNGGVFDLRTSKQVLSLNGSGGVKNKVGRAVSWSPDGRYIATTSIDGTPRVWDGRTGRLRYVLHGHVGFVFSLAWNRLAHTGYFDDLVTGGTDGVAQVWRIGPDGLAGPQSLSSQEMSGGISGVAFSPDGSKVMAGGTAVKVWDLGHNGEWGSPPSPGPAEFLSNGRVVGPARDGTTLTVWDVRSARSLKTMEPAPFAISTLTVSPDRRAIAAGGYNRAQCGDEMAATWDVGTGARGVMLNNCPVTDVAFSPDGRYAAAATLGGEVRITPVPGGFGIAGIGDDEYSFSRARFSPDGSMLAIAEVNITNALRPNRAAIWEWEPRNLLALIPAGRDVLLDFDPTGPRIVLIGRRGLAEIWSVRNARSPRRIATLEGSSGRVSDLAFSPDGQLVATAGDNGAVRLFDAQTGAQRLVLAGSACGISDIAFSPDGTKLASTSLCDGVRIWALDIDDLLRIARQNVTRSLTDEECRQYLHVDTCPQI